MEKERLGKLVNGNGKSKGERRNLLSHSQASFVEKLLGEVGFCNPWALDQSIDLT